MGFSLDSISKNPIAKVALGAATKALDTMGGALVGGQLVKAVLRPFSHDGQEVNRPPLKAISLMFNPAKLKITQTVTWNKGEDSSADSAAKTFGGSTGRKLTLSQVVFDTFETRENVREKYIDSIEALAQRDHQGDHAPPYVKFDWGQFGAKADPYNALPMFVVTQLDVEYTMFLNDGTPVRATVTVTLDEATPPWEQQSMRPNESPDHAKLVTLRRGDTLQSVAFAEYDDPAEWRRIADANSIDDPLDVAPGTKLLVPPILK